SSKWVYSFARGMPWKRKKVIPRLPDTSRSNGVPSAVILRVAATASRRMLPLYPPHSPRFEVMTRSSDFFTGRVASSGWLTSPAFLLRSAASSAILRVYASASVARSSAFLNRAVAISSIVLVIFRMFRTAFRRFARTRVLGMVTLARGGPPKPQRPRRPGPTLLPGLRPLLDRLD